MKNPILVLTLVLTLAQAASSASACINPSGYNDCKDGAGDIRSECFERADEELSSCVLNCNDGPIGGWSVCIGACWGERFVKGLQCDGGYEADLCYCTQLYCGEVSGCW